MNWKKRRRRKEENVNWNKIMKENEEKIVKREGELKEKKEIIGKKLQWNKEGKDKLISKKGNRGKVEPS